MDFYGGSHDVFNECYRCYSMVMMPGNGRRERINYGGKIILPQSALAKLASLNIMYPMLFHLSNVVHPGSQAAAAATEIKHTHAGVLEFIAQEGHCYLPYWMMKTLGLTEGSIIRVTSVTLPLGTLVKLQPQSVDFLDITDPRAVLEKELLNFSTLTKGDLLQIAYNSKIYEILVMQVEPSSVLHRNGVSIIETDLNVDFAPPVGYVEPTPSFPPPPNSQAGKLFGKDRKVPALSTPVGPFKGTGQKLSIRSSGPPSTSSDSNPNNSSSSASTTSRGGEERVKDIPEILDMPFNRLFFGYPYKLPSDLATEPQQPKAVFQGKGKTLRAATK